MENKSGTTGIDLICIIVNFGMGSKVLKTAKSLGIHGGTLTLAKGTANHRIWDYLGLSDIRKEVLYMVAGRETAYRALDRLDEEYKFHKPNHGIAFTTSVYETVGTSGCKSEAMNSERGEDEMMYQVITIIVDKGKAEDVITAAGKAGSKGGTIMNARGSGIHETSRVFAMDIEPEKEIVLILSEQDSTEAIVSAINKDIGIDSPGKGIIYIQDVNKTYGVYK